MTYRSNIFDKAENEHKIVNKFCLELQTIWNLVTELETRLWGLGLSDTVKSGKKVDTDLSQCEAPNPYLNPGRVVYNLHEFTT